MYKKTALSNGLRIVSHTMKGRDSVSIGIWIGAGGRYENDKIKGAAHFLEHIVFKGSQKYSCEKIKENIEGVGGALNAFTTEEQTCYFAKIPVKHFKSTLDVLADMVFHPKIQQKDVAKERTVIIEEIKMYRDLPQYFVLELLDSLLWPGHPLGKNLAGTPETVGKMTKTDLRQFHKTFYAPGNAVVAVCGALSHESIVGTVKKKLSHIRQAAHKEYAGIEGLKEKDRVKFFKKDIEQMHLAIGMPGLHEKHEDRYVLSLLSIILGGNMSSRLFVEVREKKGLAYSISSTIKMLHDTGMLLIRAGVDNNKLVEAVKVILKELRRLMQETVPQDEFKRAKEYLLGQLQLGLEDTMEHMLWLGESVVAKDEIRSLKKVISEFEKIKSSDVGRLAKQLLNEKHYKLALVGPLTGQQESNIKKLLNI